MSSFVPQVLRGLGMGMSFDEREIKVIRIKSMVLVPLVQVEQEDSLW
jgi:hypothetical protein